MKPTALFWRVVLTLLLGGGLAVASSLVGKRAPAFSVMSGDDKVLATDSIRGKVTVLFYESKDAVEKNRKLKTELNRYYREQNDATKQTIVRLPVLDCSGAFWPFKAIWKKKLREHSAKEGLTLYGDWDGLMKANFQMKEGDSNVVVIDRAGVIRYFAQGSLASHEIGKLRDLLQELGRSR